MKLLSPVCFALLLASPADAQVVTAPVAARAMPSPMASAIADQLAGNSVVLAQTKRMLRTDLPTALARNPDMQALEQRWPGVIAEFVAVMEPIIIASLLPHLPEYRRDVAAVFDKHLTPAELDRTRDFYASPAGQQLVSDIRDGADFSALLSEQIKADGEASISAADIGAASAGAVQPSINKLSASEQLSLLSFSMSSAGRKMKVINPELLEVSARFNDLKDPEADRQIDAAVEALIARRAAAKRKR